MWYIPNSLRQQYGPLRPQVGAVSSSAADWPINYNTKTADLAPTPAPHRIPAPDPPSKSPPKNITLLDHILLLANPSKRPFGGFVINASSPPLMTTPRVNMLTPGKWSILMRFGLWLI